MSRRANAKEYARQTIIEAELEPLRMIIVRGLIFREPEWKIAKNMDMSFKELRDWLTEHMPQMLQFFRTYDSWTT